MPLRSTPGRGLIAAPFSFVLLLSISSTSLPAQTVLVFDATALLREVPRLTAGTTLLLAPGTYSIPSLVLRDLAGRPDAWITIRGHAGRTTIVGTAAKNVVDVTNCSYLRLEDLAITCTGAHADIDGLKFAYQTTSRHFTADNCRFHDLTGNGVSSQAALLEHLTVQNCEIARTRASGVYLGYDSPPRLANHTTIRNCWIHDVAFAASPHYAIQIKGGSRGARIEHNVIHDVPAWNAAAIAVYWVAAGGGQRPADWNVVRANAIWRCGSEGIYVTNSAVVEDNVLIDVGSGIVVTSYGGKVVDNLRITHNTVVRCSGIGMNLAEFSRTDASCRVVNNAVLMERPELQAVRAGSGTGGATVLGNVCHGTVYGNGLAAGVVAAGAPALEFARCDVGLAAEAVDLMPRAGSTLADRVDGSLGSPRDHLRRHRPQGPGADAGAIERSPGATWSPTPGFKPAAAPLLPHVQHVAATPGSHVEFAIDVDVPPGTRAWLWPNFAGPAAHGPLPLIVDAMLLQSFERGPVLGQNAVSLDPAGRGSLRVSVPALGLPHEVAVYWAAVLVPPQGPPTATGVVRTVLR